MSKQLLYETKSVLRELRALRADLGRYYDGIREYTNYYLKKSHSKGSSKNYFYVKKKGACKAKYLGIDTHSTVKRIKEAKYTAELLTVIDNDISLLEMLQENFVIPDHDSINKRLAAIYRGSDVPYSASRSPEAAEWKKRKESEKAKYPVFMPEKLIHEALDGTMMRSLSEKIIANYLISLGITYVYELPLIHHGKRINPDFTILSPIDNKTEIIIEHQGAMDNEQYQSKFIRTILFYLSTNLIPNKDVFFTFNHLDSKLDLRQIDCILHTAFGYESSA